MPIITSTYRSPKFLFNGHLQTIYPSLYRKVKGVHFERERIDTPDDDFLDIDWASVGANQIVILSHGLEGSTESSYIRGMTRAANLKGWDSLAWNYRGCSGVPNRQLQSYHSGATHDLETIVQHVLATNRYKKIVLIGFSLGGNLSLKYAGEKGEGLHKSIQKIIAISAPTHLSAGSTHLEKGFNRIYTHRFIEMLREKVLEKARLMPDKIDLTPLKSIRTLRQFDDYYTAPINGFKNAEDYYTQCSSGQFIPHITRPTLLFNAINDPFFPTEHYPYELAQNSTTFFLETPKTGGHVGFSTLRKDGFYGSEQRVFEFI